MNRQELITLFKKITVWKRAGQRAPHKPLLVLFAIAQLNKNQRFFKYKDIHDKLKQLLIEFGPTRRNYHPEYPFYRLKNDGIWELKNIEKLVLKKDPNDVSKQDLIKFNIKGGFKKDIFDTFISNPSIKNQIVNQILEANFPISIHENILQSIGYDLDSIDNKKRVRDPNFRDRILTAYEYKCAVCGFDVRIGNTIVALEAAHIKWHMAGGPDSENNGIALCTLHHKLFDIGAFTISSNMEIQVSDRAYGTSGFKEWLLNYHGKNITAPQKPTYYPEPNFVSWHVREVFKGESRYKSY